MFVCGSGHHTKNLTRTQSCEDHPGPMDVEVMRKPWVWRHTGSREDKPCTVVQDRPQALLIGSWSPEPRSQEDKCAKILMKGLCIDSNILLSWASFSAPLLFLFLTLSLLAVSRTAAWLSSGDQTSFKNLSSCEKGGNKILGLDRADGSTTMWMYLMPLTCTLENG